MKTIVVNVKTDRYDISIMRPSKYGNPFVIGKDGNRRQVIDKYKKYLEQILKVNPNFLKPLKGKRLGCCCKPLECHGDIIVSFLEREDDNLSLCVQRV